MLGFWGGQCSWELGGGLCDKVALTWRGELALFVRSGVERGARAMSDQLSSTVSSWERYSTLAGSTSLTSVSATSGVAC